MSGIGLSVRLTERYGNVQPSNRVGQRVTGPRPRHGDETTRFLLNGRHYNQLPAGGSSAL